MREGAPAHVRLTLERRHIGQFVHQGRYLAQLFELGRRNALVTEFELQVRDDGDQVRVAAAFPEAVDSALDLHCSRLDRRDSVGHGDLGIVVAVNADWTAYRGTSGFDRGIDLVRQASAVGVAQTDQVCSGGVDRFEAGQCKLGLGEVAIEEVLGVEDYLPDALF